MISHPLKSLPSSWQILVRPMLLISLALHGILLLLPIPSKSKATPPKQEEKIKITQLPDTTPPSVASSPVSSPKPQASVTPKVASTQPSTHRFKPPATPKSAPPVRKPASASFPHYPGSVPGSLGLLSADLDKSALNTPDPIDKVAAFFKNELQNSGFNQISATQYGQLGLKLYEVPQGNSKKYLYLIPQQAKIVILVASGIIAPKDLVNAVGPSPEEYAFNDISTGFGNDNTLAVLEISDLLPTDIDIFANSSKSSFDDKYSAQFKTVSFSPVHTKDQVASFLKTNFQKAEFTFSAPTESGDMIIYTVNKNSFTRYITLLPTTEGGVGVITSQNPPGQ